MDIVSFFQNKIPLSSGLRGRSKANSLCHLFSGKAPDLEALDIDTPVSLVLIGSSSLLESQNRLNSHGGDSELVEIDERLKLDSRR